MKILWITNIPFGKLRTLAGMSEENTGGSWLNAALDDFIGDNRYNIIVATVGNVKSIIELIDLNITYCILPGGIPGKYNYKSRKNRQNWKTINDKYKPDIVQVWGTECTHGYLALQVINNIPSVIYIQGILETISRYYLSGMSTKEIISHITIRDILALDCILNRQKSYYKRSLIEAKMIQISKHIIAENLWCSAHCKAIEPSCKIHYCKLNIKADFFQHEWSLAKMIPYTIMCNGSRYPIKGLHILLKALNLVVQKYPTTRLLIPGENFFFESNLKRRLKKSGYVKFIESLIMKFGLYDHIQFLGSISSSLMANNMEKSNVFVMSSSIENHSSTLIEAMTVGTPCIASNVGGISEYLIHGKNGILYRFEEYELLSEYICTLFSDSQKAEYLGKNAKKSMFSSRNSYKQKDNLVSAYTHIIEGTKI